MKAIRASAPGGLDRLHLATLPDPAKPGPGEITVRIRASSLNYHDYAVVSGKVPLSDGIIPMSDGAGTVEAVGDGVTEFAVGDSVVSCFFPTWQDGPATIGDFSTTPGDGVDGYAREAVTCPASAFTHIPEGYSFAEAATLTTAGLTAWRALAVETPVYAGETVLVMGTGGVSIFALQFARMLGAKVIALSSSDEKLARMQAMGAEVGINYRTHEKWAPLVLDHTNGKGVDHVIEVGGPATLGNSIAACRVGGHISLIGVLTGFAGQVPIAALITRQALLRGLMVGSRAMQEDMIVALDRWKLKPVIDRSFPLEGMADAFRHQESGRHFGKIVLEY
jgi:NADPH:quinone reductase-like Zn-dependent oxidoreductase